VGSFNRSDHAALAIQAHGLTKSFGGTRALDGLDLAVPAATVYGFVGPNGAGKTPAATSGRSSGSSSTMAPQCC
jgi:ABC-type transporter Mla maintaining outer membrane lipid asymmetry ATPase subunit MlaF